MQAHHPVTLGAPRDIAAGALALLQRDDEDFVEATLDELRSAAGRAALRGRRAVATDVHGIRKLFQPIQRRFHPVLLEAWCDLPGTPRLDPAKVEAAGLVLRRLGAGGRLEGWMRTAGRVRGWVPLTRVGGDDADPVAALRLERARTGVPDIDRALAALARSEPDRWLDEDVTPLFVAPPEVCAEAGRTFIFGVAGTVSSEFGETAASAVGGPDALDFGPQSAAFRRHLVEALRGEPMDFPFPGETLRSGWADAMEALGDDAPAGVGGAQAEALRDPVAEHSRRMRRLLLLLRQLSGEFAAFDSGPEGTALRTLLAEIRLPLVLRGDETVPRHLPADQFLQQAHTLLLEKGAANAPEMPERWPALGADLARRLAAALHRSMQARFSASVGRSGRFDEPGARYVLRAFVRLKAEGACPARLVWGGLSEPFVIAPWYEGGGAPPVQINLPDPTDKGLLKALKPNVAFVVPPALQNLLSGSAKDLLEGKGSTGTLGITWICSFSIPIITICAFLVLNIFLTLFNIVFGWMFFLKICIPLPKFGDKPPGGGP